MRALTRLLTDPGVEMCLLFVIERHGIAVADALHGLCKSRPELRRHLVGYSNAEYHLARVFRVRETHVRLLVRPYVVRSIRYPIQAERFQPSFEVLRKTR
jgi:hypothetical protein